MPRVDSNGPASRIPILVVPKFFKGSGYVSDHPKRTWSDQISRCKTNETRVNENRSKVTK
jgi:hypothetical protein